MIDLLATPGHLARRFQQIAVAVFQLEVEGGGFDLTPVQYVALATLASHKGIDQAGLAALIAHDRTTMGGVIDRLEVKGLLQRRISAEDRRARVLEITPQGRQLLKKIEPYVLQAQDNMLCGLSKQETRQFLALLSKAVAGANDFSRAPLKASVPEPKNASKS